MNIIINSYDEMREKAKGIFTITRKGMVIMEEQKVNEHNERRELYTKSCKTSSSS